MKDVTVKQAQEKRDNLKETIAKVLNELVRDYERDTGLIVTGISVDVRDIGTLSQRAVHVSVDVAIDL